MNGLNKNESCFLAAAAATVLTVAILMATSSMMTAPAAAAKTTGILQYLHQQEYSCQEENVTRTTVNITTAPRNANADTMTIIATNIDFFSAGDSCWRFEENCAFKIFLQKSTVFRHFL
jgi:hypothetical protein